MTVDWSEVGKGIRARCAEEDARETDAARLDAGQRDSLRWISTKLPKHGVVLADEVGIGKTRIACAVAHAAVAAGGRVAVVVPHGLIHQWQAESKKLSEVAPSPKTLTTLSDFFRDAPTGGEPWNARRPRPGTAEWWIISHNFRAPIVKARSVDWRYSLPALVGMRLATTSERDDARTRWGKLQRNVQENSLHESARGWTGMARIAEEAVKRVRRDGRLLARVRNLPEYNATSWENAAVVDTFTEEGEGRLATEAILGHWLGDFDLVIIDEAHKSRRQALDDESDEQRTATGSVLSRLVDRVLRSTTDARRLCLTATPMELDLGQWIELLKRARCGLDDEVGLAAIRSLREAASDAVVAPDEPRRIAALEQAARRFTETLRPYVTRRRRDADPLVDAFRIRFGVDASKPHPHRKLSRTEVDWIAQGDQTAWADVLFAAECLSESLRGLPRSVTHAWPQSLQGIYTKLAAGHVAADVLDAEGDVEVPEGVDLDRHTVAKVQRVAYWQNRLRQSRSAVTTRYGAGPAIPPEYEHPRVRAAVDLIERRTLHPTRPEKVLVFGVFLKPLSHLRDALNVRHALHSADEGRPVVQAIHSDERLRQLAQHEAVRLDLGGSLRGLSARALRDALSHGHEQYTRKRRAVHDKTKSIVRGWTTGDGPLANSDLDEKLCEALTIYAMDRTLEVSTSDVAPPLDQLAERFWAERVLPLLGEDDGDGTDSKKSACLGELRAVLNDDDARQSTHARVLYGQTRWATRRYIQAAFNREAAAPWVLIAQSQVGREGLNLHEQCRFVLQFHAEWNPAVLEQQIGRVDRKHSLWERLAREWLDRGGSPDDAPFIEVQQLVLKGTYDAFQWLRVDRRKHTFDASLFGALLPEDAWGRVPEARRAGLVAAAPDFSPPAAKER